MGPELLIRALVSTTLLSVRTLDRFVCFVLLLPWKHFPNWPLSSSHPFCLSFYFYLGFLSLSLSLVFTRTTSGLAWLSFCRSRWMDVWLKHLWVLNLFCVSFGFTEREKVSFGFGARYSIDCEPLFLVKIYKTEQQNWVSIKSCLSEHILLNNVWTNVQYFMKATVISWSHL